MDTLSADTTSVLPTASGRRVWKFWGPALWGLFIFTAMSVGQLTVLGYLLLQRTGPGRQPASMCVAVREARRVQVVDGRSRNGCSVRPSGRVEPRRRRAAVQPSWEHVAPGAEYCSYGT